MHSQASPAAAAAARARAAPTAAPRCRSHTLRRCPCLPACRRCPQGYQFYLVIFYILVSVLFVSTAICIWVGVCFMNDSFPFLWPIKVARIVVSLFVSMFYIASLNVFLMACACERQPSGRWTHLYFNLGARRSLDEESAGSRGAQQPAAQRGASRRASSWLAAAASSSWRHSTGRPACARAIAATRVAHASAHWISNTRAARACCCLQTA